MSLLTNKLLKTRPENSTNFQHVTSDLVKLLSD